MDWVGSVVAGHGARAVESIAQFARAAGPITGPSEQINARRGTSAFFAAMANAAASHVAEQDDVHNGSVFHPATIVFPAALAVAQEIGASGKDFLTAAVVGYEVGIRVGEYLGRPHYRIFHTTGTAGTLAAAAAVGSLLKLTPDQMLHAFGSAGTMSAGLWEFLRPVGTTHADTGRRVGHGAPLATWLVRAGRSGPADDLSHVETQCVGARFTAAQNHG